MFSLWFVPELSCLTVAQCDVEGQVPSRLWKWVKRVNKLIVSKDPRTRYEHLHVRSFSQQMGCLCSCAYHSSRKPNCCCDCQCCVLDGHHFSPHHSLFCTLAFSFSRLTSMKRPLMPWRRCLKLWFDHSRCVSHRTPLIGSRMQSFAAIWVSLLSRAS